jgi:hypothetical protein
MNADLTIDTLTFKQSFSDKDGSLRVETSRGVNLQERLRIKHRPYTDSRTKRPGTESVIQLERDQALADGSIASAILAQFKVSALVDTGVTSSDVLAAAQRIISVLQEDDSGLDLMDEIFVNKEQ